MKSRMFLVLLCIFVGHRLLAQANSDKYVIIKMNIKYSKRNAMDSFWIIPQKQMNR